MLPSQGYVSVQSKTGSQTFAVPWKPLAFPTDYLQSRNHLHAFCGAECGKGLQGLAALTRAPQSDATIGMPHNGVPLTNGGER
jgi:hypothetical protein